MTDNLFPIFHNLSVIISTYDREYYVNQLLDSIQSQTCIPKEIIISDSSKFDLNYKVPISLNVKVVKSKIAQLTYQRNFGVSFAKYEIILHIDDDVILEVDYIENIMDTFKKDKKNQIDVVGGYISNEWNKKNIKNNLIVKLFNHIGLFDGQLLPGKISNTGIFIELQGLDINKGICRTDFISGTSFAVRSLVYEKYAHPESVNKYGGEDKVFSRMIGKDYQMVINTKARLKHLYAQSGNRDSDYTSYKNTVRFNIYIQKYFPKIDSSTIVLRTYYFLLGIQLMATGVMGFFIGVETRKNKNRVIRGFGYLSGSVSIN